MSNEEFLTELLQSIRIEPIKEKDRLGVKIESRFLNASAYYNVEGLDEEKRRRLELAIDSMVSMLRYALEAMNAVNQVLAMVEAERKVSEGERGEEEA
jgi:hypothetical protein